MSVDDQRMTIARTVLQTSLDIDTLGIVINYARYAEAEKVMIILLQNAKDEFYTGCIEYKHYYTGPLIYEDLDDPDNELERCFSECHMRINGYDKFTNNLLAGYKSPPLFLLGFGNFSNTIGKVNITLDDLLPSTEMKTINVPTWAKIIFDICRPQYLAEMREAINKI